MQWVIQFLNFPNFSCNTTICENYVYFSEASVQLFNIVIRYPLHVVKIQYPPIINVRNLANLAVFQQLIICLVLSQVAGIVVNYLVTNQYFLVQYPDSSIDVIKMSNFKRRGAHCAETMNSHGIRRKLYVYYKVLSTIQSCSISPTA